MALRSLNKLRKLRLFLTGLRKAWMRRVLGVSLGDEVSLSLSSRLLPGRRGSIVVGDETLIAFKTLIYTFDPLTRQDRPIRIGRRCFIGGGSMVLPGVTIGDDCIVGAGAVVMEDVPSRSIVGGVPARVLRSDIEVGRYGRLKGADANTRAMYHPTSG